MAPAFDSTRSEELTQTVLDAMCRYGFREQPPDYVLEQWESAGKKWQRFLHRHRPAEMAQKA
jgi:hypothetical protein